MIQVQYIVNLLWLLAIVPAVVLYLLYEKWKTTRKKRLGDLPLVEQMLKGSSPKRYRTKAIIFIVAIAMLAIGLINIQKPVEEAGGGIKGLDVMIALDVSNSMLANDVAPNRLEKARLLASKLIDTLQGNRVGIIAFAGNAYLQLPLTTDITAARLYLQSINTSLVPVQGTNIHEALQLANSSMDVGVHDYKAVVLITDGEELDEHAMDAAKELKQAGVVLLTTGVGTPNGATIVMNDGQPKRDENGKTVISKLNEKLLSDLAGLTNGSYRLLNETDVALQSLVTEINSMDQKPISNANLVNYKSYSHILIFLAFLLLIIDLFIPERIGRKEAAIATPKKKRMAQAAALSLALLLISSFSFGQNSKLLLRKANEAYRQNQYTEAARLYHEVLKTDPENAVAKYNLGNIAYRQKQFQKAVDQYNEAIESKTKESTKANAYNNKGLSYVENKDLQKAIDAFKQSLRENPYDSEVRMNLNKALKEKQQQDQQQQQQQKDQNKQNNKQDKPQPPPPSKMKQKEAEDKLAALRQEEKKIRDKMNKQAAGEPESEKDW